MQCGDRVAELVQAAWLYPSQPFLLPCAEGAVSILTSPMWDIGVTLICKVITRSPIWKLELIKFDLEIESTAWQLPRRGAGK